MFPPYKHLHSLSSFSTQTTRFLSLLTQCSTFKHLTQAHAFAIVRGLDRDDLLVSDLITTSSLLGFDRYAFSVFKLKPNPNIFLFNTMIKILSRSQSPKDAIFLFNSIQALNLRPDTYSFPFVLKAVACLSAVNVGKQIHGQIVRYGSLSDVHVLTALIHMYSNCGSIGDARLVFDGMPHRDVIVWNAMVAGCVKAGDVDCARGLFDRMTGVRNVVSWTTVIAGYAQMNRSDEAIVVFRRMQVEDGIEPDEIALLAVLSACANLGALDLGEWIHGFIDRRRLHKIVPLMNALIDMYAKSGNIEKAVEVFENMSNRSVVTWTTMIAGFALHGLGKEALTTFRRMESENVKPNDVTFLAILAACSHIGLTDLGRWYFGWMSSHYHIKPKIEHYGCMVDLLGRAGCLKEAHDLIREMPFEANAAIWGALLSAARMRGDVEMGELALRHLVEVEPHNSGNYTLLSNIYAAFEKWDGVGKLRKVMKDGRVTKIPGGSSIEINGRVHEFTSRDGVHPCFERINKVLFEIYGHMKINGNFINTFEGQIAKHIMITPKGGRDFKQFNIEIFEEVESRDNKFCMLQVL